MNYGFETANLTPEQFEREVKALLEALGLGLTGFTAHHREIVEGVDGEYEIDVAAHFEALGADFRVLVECKHQKSPIKREVVQILFDRIRSTGAHKGMIFATTTFQSGAIEYATKHGIALVTISEGSSSYRTRSAGPTAKPPPWVNIPPFIGWLTTLSDEGNESHRNVSIRDPEKLREYIES